MSQGKKKNLKSARPSQGVLRINITLTGEEIPEYYRQWKRRGLVTSTRDAVTQAFRLFQERLIEFDLKKAQLDSEDEG